MQHGHRLISFHFQLECLESMPGSVTTSVMEDSNSQLRGQTSGIPQRLPHCCTPLSENMFTLLEFCSIVSSSVKLSQFQSSKYHLKCACQSENSISLTKMIVGFAYELSYQDLECIIIRTMNNKHVQCTHTFSKPIPMGFPTPRLFKYTCIQVA